VLVTTVRGHNFRCYERVEIGFAPGLVGIVGPNGAGKTSLVEMIHFGALAYSPRTAGEAQMIAFGHDFTRVELEAELATGAARVEVGFRPGEPKRITVDGVAERSAAGLLGRFAVLVFTPDRIRLVQGAPAMRRTYLDRALVRLWPALAEVPAAYARALAQRNHLLRRLRAGFGAEEGLVGWDDVTARAGSDLIAARERLCALLAPAFAARLEQLGGDPGLEPLRLLSNTAGDALAGVLRERHRRDIERAATGAGPHLDDFELNESGRDLRRFGSQGEQRRALLALILAEADLLTEERGEQPVLLLDDVTGEFDAARRSLLLDAVSRFQQAIVTTTDEADLESRPASVVHVEAGTVRG
jgi:DNA replication and repair protein RecF